MLEAIWLYCKNMQNLENLAVFEILITQNLLKCPKDPFVRSALIFIFVVMNCKQKNLETVYLYIWLNSSSTLVKSV